MLFIGVDGLSHRVLEKEDLPSFRGLMRKGYRKIRIREADAISAVMWNAIFAGIPPSQVTFRRYNLGDKVFGYEEIPFRRRFPWEIRRDIPAVAVPVVLPPYSNVRVDLVEKGLALDKEKCDENMFRIADTISEFDDGIAVFTEIDRVSHFHWGEEALLDSYRKLDSILGDLEKKGKGIVVFSDHGFRDMPKGRSILRREGGIKGDHDPVQLVVGTDRVEFTTDIYILMMETFKFSPFHTER